MYVNNLVMEAILETTQYVNLIRPTTSQPEPDTPDVLE